MHSQRLTESAKEPPFDRRIMHILQNAGWSEETDEAGLEAEYQRLMPECWNSPAAEFVRRFGNLSIAHSLWVTPEQAAVDLCLRNRIEQRLGRKCCPVASWRRLGENASLWIDAKGCYYAMNLNCIEFVAENTGEALDVLLLGTPPLPAPPEVRDRLARGAHRSVVH